MEVRSLFYLITAYIYHYISKSPNGDMKYEYHSVNIVEIIVGWGYVLLFFCFDLATYCIDLLINFPVLLVHLTEKEI